MKDLSFLKHAEYELIENAALIEKNAQLHILVHLLIPSKTDAQTGE